MYIMWDVGIKVHNDVLNSNWIPKMFASTLDEERKQKHLQNSLKYFK